MTSLERSEEEYQFYVVYERKLLTVLVEAPLKPKMKFSECNVEKNVNYICK